MGQLNFGHRLGILKRAWGIAINQSLADFLCFGEDKAFACCTQKGLSFQSVHRWITNAHGLTNSTYSESELCVNFVKFAGCSFDGRPSYLCRFGANESELQEALLNEDDMFFVKFVVAHSNEASNLTINHHVQLPLNGGGKVPPFFDGRFVLYRLGIKVDRKFGKVVPGNAQQVLRQIPVEFYKDGSATSYRERFLDGTFQSESTGTVFRRNEYLNILGQDRSGNDCFEWFFFFISATSQNGFYQGIVSMEGDIGVPSAYRVLLRQATEQEMNTQSWDDYCKMINATYIITDGCVEHTGASHKSKQELNLQNIIELLSLKDSQVGLYD